MVGGGLGDIEEVLAAGRLFEHAGCPVYLLRLGGRPLPRSVEGPWDWPHVRRVHEIIPTRPRALTISAGWGITAAPARQEPLGRGGPWARESEMIERAYSSGATIHISFEEFARTLGTAGQERERLREGGVRAHDIRRQLRGRGPATFRDRVRTLYRKFRALDRPNVLHVVPTFVYSRAYASEFPETVQTGPFWPGKYPPKTSRTSSGRRFREFVVFWYASPSSSDRLLQRVVAGSRGLRRPVRVQLRSPRKLPLVPVTNLRWEELAELDPARWHRKFRQADLRIVTGSRTLLEAIELGSPFLYFNGVLGVGPCTRRHRPEKLQSLLALWHKNGVDPRWVRDVRDFSRLQRVGPVLARALQDEGWRRRFPVVRQAAGFFPPYDDARRLLLAVLDRFSRGVSSTEVVAEARAGGLSQ